jgi:hemerythrin-like metal-binding protein
VDDQHRKLISIANELIKALHFGYAHKIVSKVIRELREYTVYHFNDEEALMKEVGYHDLPEHQRQHEALTRQVKDYQDALYRKQQVKPGEIRDFIKDWLIGHILTHDGALANHIREQKSEDHLEKPKKDNTAKTGDESTES